MKIIFTGGGSGGHVMPALAVAKQLQAIQPGIELLYIGGTMTMQGSTGPSVEQTLVGKTGIPFIGISAGKLNRDGLSLNTLTRLWGVIPGCFQAYKAIKQAKAQAVFSSGGYVSLPVVLAAWAQGLPILIHEQTSAVGLTNKIAANLAKQVAITFPQSADYFPANKVILTGNPLNQDIVNPVDTAQLEPEFANWLNQASAKPLLYVTGGGLGSHVINLAVEEVLPQLLSSYRLVHQTGDNQRFADYDRLIKAKDQLSPELAQNYYPVKHLASSAVGHLYRQASLIIARAGANTVIELAHWAKPTIFVPIPWVTHDEQTKNAQTLVEAGTATILPEADLSGASLLQHIEQRLTQPLSDDQVQAAQSLVKPQADQAIAQLVLDLATHAKAPRP